MSIVEIVDRVSTVMKVVGALLLGISVVPVFAFSALLAGCSFSALTALRVGDHGGLAVNISFAIANGLGLARTFGLFG